MFLSIKMSSSPLELKVLNAVWHKIFLYWLSTLKGRFSFNFENQSYVLCCKSNNWLKECCNKEEVSKFMIPSFCINSLATIVALCFCTFQPWLVLQIYYTLSIDLLLFFFYIFFFIFIGFNAIVLSFRLVLKTSGATLQYTCRRSFNPKRENK